MADTILGDAQHLTVTIGLNDTGGNPVTGDVLDAGTVTATFPETTNLTAVVSADQTTVLVTAEGPLVTGDVLTVTGSLAGVALKPGVLPFDVTAGAASAITLTAGAPVDN